MMQIENLATLYVSSLQEVRNMEIQILGALKEIAEDASTQALTASSLSRHSEIEARCNKLDEIIERHNANPTDHVDQAMKALIAETKKMSAIVSHPVLRDVGIIDSLRRIEHYSIASYSGAAMAAKHLGLFEEEAELSAAIVETENADWQLQRLADSSLDPTPLSPKVRRSASDRPRITTRDGSYPFSK